MNSYTYENHIMQDRLLPFIYHPRFTVAHRTSPPNWHENTEILYCLEGYGYVRCGPEQIPFQPGDLCVINADTPHCIGSDTSVSYRCLIIGTHFCRDNGIPALRFQNRIRDNGLCRQFEAVAEAFAKKEQNAVCSVADIRYAVLGLLRMLCHRYAAATPELNDTGPREDIKKAISYIRQNMTQTITLDSIVRHVGISKFHLAREFKTYTGSTVINTVNLIRCTQARQMIEQGTPVSTAATACGYQNLSYFTKTFQKHFHVLPSSLLPKNK